MLYCSPLLFSALLSFAWASFHCQVLQSPLQQLMLSLM